MYCSACGTEMATDAKFCPKCGAGTAAGKAGSSPFGEVLTRVQDDSTLLAVATHLGGIFFSFVPSLIVYLLKKDSRGWVYDSAQEALNWQLTLMVGYAASALLSLILIGLAGFWILSLANVVLSIVGAIKASERTVYHYPIVIRFLK